MIVAYKFFLFNIFRQPVQQSQSWTSATISFYRMGGNCHGIFTCDRVVRLLILQA